MLLACELAQCKCRNIASKDQYIYIYVQKFYCPTFGYICGFNGATNMLVYLFLNLAPAQDGSTSGFRSRRDHRAGRGRPFTCEMKGSINLAPVCHI